MKYKIGILYTDGQFSLHRKNELMGAEGLYIKNTLLAQPQVEQVDILTTAMNQCGDVQLSAAEDLNVYTDIILFWSSVNQWGGELNYEQFLVYKFLHSYKGHIWYWFEDTRFPLIEFTTIIGNRKFWNNNPLCDLSELTLPPGIHFLSMFDNEELVLNANSTYNVTDVYKCPMYLTHMDDRKIKLPIFGRTVDLIYGGFNRAQKRNAFYKEFFFTRQKIFVELYGTIEKDVRNLDTGKCILSPRVPYQDVLSKNTSGLATLIPAEKGYSNNCITPRIVEALMSNCICFIQNEFDIEHKILNDNFFYVTTGDELEEKIIELKNNDKLYQEKLVHQQNILKKLSNENLGKILVDIIDHVHSM